MEEEKYETIEILVRCREDGQSWFDIIADVISEDCELNPTGTGCSCGLESMGGSTGTLDQCYDHMRVSEKWATVETEDLKVVVSYINECPSPPSAVWQAMKRLKKEAYWHDEFNEWLANLPEEEEDGI